jgi:hypothetical protein
MARVRAREKGKEARRAKDAGNNSLNERKEKEFLIARS